MYWRKRVNTYISSEPVGYIVEKLEESAWWLLDSHGAPLFRAKTVSSCMIAAEIHHIRNGSLDEET